MAYEPVTLLPDDSRLSNMITSTIGELGRNMAGVNVVEWTEEFQAGPNGSLLAMHRVMTLFLNYDLLVRLYLPYNTQDEYISRYLDWLHKEARSLTVNLISIITESLDNLPHKNLMMPMVEEYVRIIRHHKLCEIDEQFLKELILCKLSK